MLFLDSDDWWILDLCEKTYQKAEETGAQMTIFFHSRIREQIIRSITANDKISTEEKLPLLVFVSACTQLWRTDFLLDNQLYFPVGLTCEDHLVYWQAVTLANKISIISEKLYHYRERKGSITQTRSKHMMDIVPIFNKIRTYLLESGYYEEYRDEFIAIKLKLWKSHYHLLPASMLSEYVTMVRNSMSADDREFFRIASKGTKLFYDMIEGGSREAMKYQIYSVMKRSEQICRQWVIKPIKKRLKAA